MIANPVAPAALCIHITREEAESRLHCLRVSKQPRVERIILERIRRDRAELPCIAAPAVFNFLRQLRRDQVGKLVQYYGFTTIPMLGSASFLKID